MDIEDKVKQILESLNLNEKEQKVYLALLDLGPCLQTELAKKSGIKRTTLREILPSLNQRGIVLLTVRGKRQYLEPRDPRDLIEQLEDKILQSKKYLPELLALLHSSDTKPQVFYFEGIEGIKKIYQTILEVKQPIYAFLQIKDIDSEIYQWINQEFIPQKTLLKIKAYNIISSDSQDKLDENELRQNKYLDHHKFPFQMEVISFGDYVGLIHYRRSDKPTSVLLQSIAAAQTIKSIHQALWNSI